MPVSSARVREIRKQLDDAARDLEGDAAYAELADVVAAAADGFAEMTDERGELVEAAPAQVGARVKRAPEEPADEPEDEVDVPDPDEPDVDEPVAKKRKLPPQFRR